MQLYLIGSRCDSLSNKSMNLVCPKSIATAAPVFGHSMEFGGQFTGKYKFQSFRQLVKRENIPTNQEQSVTLNQNQSPEMKLRYSHRSYGRRPILEPFPPLKEQVTFAVNFKQFDNFGILKWD